MKLMRKNWKDRKGVSPVIATILMVAITVVLAAVLYVMVMGFGGDSGGQAPTVSTAKNVDAKRIVVSIDSPTDIDNFKINQKFVKPDAAKLETDYNYTTGVLGLTFVDAGNDGKINTGDFFTYTDAVSGTFNLLWDNGDVSQVVATFTI